MYKLFYFRHFSKQLKLAPWVGQTSCAKMKVFGADGAASRNLFWEQDWSRKYRCKLVSYQTQYSALVPGKTTFIIIYLFSRTLHNIFKYRLCERIGFWIKIYKTLCIPLGEGGNHPSPPPHVEGGDQQGFVDFDSKFYSYYLPSSRNGELTSLGILFLV